MDGAALSHAVETREAPGVLRRLAATWADPRGASAPEIAQAGEGRLLAYALIGSLIHTAGALAAGAVDPSLETAADPTGWATAALAGGLFVRPLALYGTAAALGLGCRIARGKGSWRASRAATFWTGLAAAPVAAALAVAGALLGRAGAETAAGIAGAAGGVLWALMLAPALAEAHGFRRAWPILAALALVAVALAVAAS